MGVLVKIEKHNAHGTNPLLTGIQKQEFAIATNWTAPAFPHLTVVGQTPYWIEFESRAIESFGQKFSFYPAGLEELKPLFTPEGM
jgi:hypothetical protein